MAIVLDLSSEELGEERLQRFAFGLNRALSDAEGLRSEVAEAPAEAGDRGAALVVGKILLEVLKSAGAAALIEVLGAWLTQEPSIRVKMTLPSGTVVEVDARNVDSEELRRVLRDVSGPGAAA